MKPMATCRLRDNVRVRLAVASLSVLGLLCSCAHRRVHRKHANVAAEEFAHLTRRINFPHRGDMWLSRKEAEKDLDELEWLLENRFSYLRLKGVDYRSGLDSIRSVLGDGTTRGALAVQMMKLVALFGDGHSQVGPTPKTLSTQYLPFLVGDSKGRLVALRTDRSGFLDERHPFLCKIDGLELDVWLKAAGRTVPKGSRQFVRHRSIRNLRHIQCLRRELGREPSREVEVELAAASGPGRRTVVMPVTDKCPRYGSWPRTKSQILRGNIGYFRIPVWMSNEPEFLEGLVAAMDRFRNTRGLIIDIRGVGGGSRAPLRVMFPFFMAADDPPQVLNVAAFRRGHRKDILDARWLYPVDWKGWSPAERAAIQRQAKTFRPEWRPARKEFSDWHYIVIGPCHKPTYYYYDRPVIILIDTTNFSASDIFLGAFKGWGNVTLMGTPSGGGSGRCQQYRLRHSFMRVRLSSMASFRPNGWLYEGRGIQPDVLIEPIPTDYIGTTDSILNAAVQRILEGPAKVSCQQRIGSYEND